MFKPCYFLLLFCGFLLAFHAEGKSLRELYIGRTELGYRFSGGVDANIAGKPYEASYHSVYLGYRLPFRPFSKEISRITWDTAFDIGVLGTDDAPLRGSRMGLRTGLGYEYLIVQNWLLKLDLGVNLARTSTRLTTGTAAEESSLEFGGHFEGSVLYSPHPRVSAFLGLGIETFGGQNFSGVEIDSGASPTFTTGIIFPW